MGSIRKRIITFIVVEFLLVGALLYYVFTSLDGISYEKIFIFNFLIFAFPIVYFVGPLLKYYFDHRRILKIGYPGRAKVLSSRSTGIRVNEQMVIELELEVQSDINLYTTRTRTILPFGSFISLGDTLNVKIHPKNQKKVVVVW